MSETIPIDVQAFDSAKGLEAQQCTPQEEAMSRALSDAIGAAMTPKPTLLDMHAMAEREEIRARSSAFTAAMLMGHVNQDNARRLAIWRRLMDFLALCVEHEDDLMTFFRAKAHNARRRG